MKKFGMAIVALALPVAAQAQDFWANTLPTITGTDAGSEARRQATEGSNARSASTATQGGGCSIDALSPAEKQSLYAEYTRVKSSQGAAAADAWIKVKGRSLYSQMAAQGRC